jgi:hypothetical protein
MTLLNRFLKAQYGVTAIEYGLFSWVPIDQLASALIELGQHEHPLSASEWFRANRASIVSSSTLSFPPVPFRCGSRHCGGP